MKLSIDSNYPLEKYDLEDLEDNLFKINLDAETNLPDGWYKLVVEYTGDKIEISDIKINDQSIRYYIYTGFFQETSGKIHQPACAVWTEGQFNIWIHTNLGYMIQKLEESIRPGEHGQNLFEKYFLTVDKAVQVDKGFRNDIKAYFKNANGPRWWRKGDVNNPYAPCDVNLKDINKSKLIAELEQNFTKVYSYDIPGKDGANIQVTAKKLKDSNELPFIELVDVPGSITRDLCGRLGYKRILNITFNVLPSGGSFNPHLDNFYHKDTYDYLIGSNNFLWSLSDDPKANYFKLSEAGMLPIQHGAFVNLGKFSHCTANQSDSERILLTIHGDRGLTNNQKML
jgi:hypothetical protein